MVIQKNIKIMRYQVSDFLGRPSLKGAKTEADPHVSLLPLEVGKNWTSWSVFYAREKEDVDL